MQTPINPFKQALAEKRAQIGLWVGLADHYTTEICAGFGDWQTSLYVLPYAVGSSYFVDQGNCSPPGNGHRGAQREYCVSSESLSPSFCWIAAITSGLANCPAIMRATLPGSACVTTKITPEMMTRMTAIMATRLAT